MSKLTVFQTEEQFNKIYEKCLATMPQATKAIETSYHGMDDMFNDYMMWVSKVSGKTDF